MASLKHENIVIFKKIFETRHYIFLEMEHVKGRQLAKFIRQTRDEGGTVGDRTAAAIVKDILNGVHYIHQLNFIHRDLKPENIILAGKNERIKIVDFGLSTVFKTSLIHSVADKVGTLLYMAPEQSSYQNYGKKIDIWSIGIIMYILLTGEHPFHKQGDTEETFLQKLRKP